MVETDIADGNAGAECDSVPRTLAGIGIVEFLNDIVAVAQTVAMVVGTQPAF